MLSATKNALTGEVSDSLDLTKCYEFLNCQQKKAEEFLWIISKEEEVKTLIPEKLFFKRLKIGNGSPVKEKDMPTLLLQIYEIKPDGDELSWVIDPPRRISLELCLPGIRQGVLGMLTGEKRRIYMHPDLMHGKYGPLRVYNPLYFDVEIVANE